MSPVAPHIVYSYVTGINHACHFTWQAQYLVTLVGDTCCSAHCKWRFIYVTDINHESHFAWQAQHLLILGCHFSWQAQYLVKIGWIAGARNVVP